MVKASDRSKILWWALQNMIMNAQQLTFHKEAVSDLKAFLEEIMEISGGVLENINQAECKLLADFNSVK